ncbi:MAG: hypothetical protein ACR2QK_08100, partial [Acidimicrobiales bacterium]
MPTLGRLWWIPLVVLIGIFVKALLLTPWVAGKAEDAALAALAGENLGAVQFVEVSGVDGLGGDGLNVVLEGPADSELAAIAAVESADEIDTVSYRVVDGQAGAADAHADNGAADTADSTGAASDDRDQEPEEE